MRLEELELINFCQHRRRHITFHPGLTAIIGPNGSGKSNLFGATKLALTGEHPNVGGKAANISSFAGPNERSLVSLLFSHGSTRAHVRRFLTSGQTTLHVENGETVRGDRRVNATIMEILGIDKQIINDVVMVDQGDIFGFLAQERAVRAAAFGKLFGTDQAERCWSALGKHAGKIEVPTAAVTADSYHQTIQADRQELARITEVLGSSTSVAVQDEIDQLMTYQIKIGQRNTITSKKDRLQGELRLAGQNQQEAEVKLAEIDADIQALSTAADECKPLAEAARASLQTLVHRRQVEAQRQQTSNMIDDRRRELNALVEPALPEDYESGDMTEVVNEARRAAQRTREFVMSFDPAHKRVECYVCHTPVENLMEPLEHARQELPTLEANYNRLLSQHERSTAYRKALAEYRTESTRISDLIRVLERQRDGMQVLGVPEVSESELKKTVNTHQEYLDAIDSLRDARGPWQAATTRWKTQMESLQQQLEQAERELAAVAIPSISIDESAVPQMLAERRAQLPVVQQHEQARAAIEARIRQSTEFLQAVEKAEQTARINRQWLARVGRYRDVLHRDAAPRFVAQQNLARAQIGVNDNLAMFDADFRVVSDDALSFQANFVDGRQQPGNRLSFGQKIILALSFRLALNFMFGDLHFLALDEPTAWLDSHHIEGFEPVLQRLRAFTASRGFQCLIITHEQLLAPLFDSVEQL